MKCFSKRVTLQQVPNYPCKQRRQGLRPAGTLKSLFKETSWFYMLLQDTVVLDMVILSELSHIATSVTWFHNVLIWGDHKPFRCLSASGTSLQGSATWHLLPPRSGGDKPLWFSVLPWHWPSPIAYSWKSWQPMAWTHHLQPVTQFYPMSPHRPKRKNTSWEDTPLIAQRHKPSGRVTPFCFNIQIKSLPKTNTKIVPKDKNFPTRLFHI